MKPLACLLLVCLVGPLGVARGDRLADAAAEVGRREGARSEVAARRSLLEQRLRVEAEEIDRQKGQPVGVARDYRLRQLLAAAQERAGELAQLQIEQRQRDAALAEARRRLVAECDRGLADPALDAGRRSELSRRRGEQAARLGGAVPTLLALPAPAPAIDPLDGPAELGEKADALKDSEDKLRREVDRLGRQIDHLETGRRLRERAGAVEEDLFIESASGRRIVRVIPAGDAANRTGAPADALGAAETKAAPAPPNEAPGFQGAGRNDTPAAGGAAGTPTTTTLGLRGVLDPATLDELRRAEGSQDLDGQLRALRRSQTSLQKLADQLARRESELRQRARQLRK